MTSTDRVQPGDLCIPNKGLWRSAPPQVFDLKVAVLEVRAYRFVQSKGTTVIVADPETGEEHTFCHSVEGLYKVDAELEQALKVMSIPIVKGRTLVDAHSCASLFQLIWRDKSLPRSGMRGSKFEAVRDIALTYMPKNCCSVGDLNSGSSVGDRCDQEMWEWLENPENHSVIRSELLSER